jgi:hypothetical protein
MEPPPAGLAFATRIPAVLQLSTIIPAVAAQQCRKEWAGGDASVAFTKKQQCFFVNKN